ncbi:oxidoreductase [Gordonia phage LittleFella]|nr:oxidoreductase [Gordonia phage LittleFella]
MRAAILGCGPTGLLAAHACAMNYVDVAIFSKKRKSELYGSQYLHNPIPGLTPEYDQGVPVKYVTRGTPEEYRRKTHGKWWDGHIGANEFEPDHTAWNIRHAYDVLWGQYSRFIQDYTIPEMPTYGVSSLGVSKYSAADIVIDDLRLHEYDLVISTVPRPLWAISGDEFIYSEGWALGDAPERGLFVEDEMGFRDENFSMADNTIVCDGTSQVPWTRLSKVYGYTTVEWPHHVPQPHPKATRVQKPLHYTPAESGRNPTSEWLHVGRYGQFEKGVVVTDAFDQVVKAIKNLK